MLHAFLLSVGVIFLIPVNAAASEGIIFSQISILILLGQAVPFIHILWSKKISSCYKTGYCVLYTSILVISWLFVLSLPSLIPGVSEIILLLILTVPFLFWIYTFTLGKAIRDSEDRICSASYKK